MISKNQIKDIQSLHQKKYRQLYGNFLVEGHKSVSELLRSNYTTKEIFATAEWIVQNGDLLSDVKITEVSVAELQKISTQETPHQVVAVAKIPDVTLPEKLPDGCYIAVDNLNDPGNAGTIIRNADWFGFRGVIFSRNSVEAFNPKTVSAAKGSIFNTNVIYADLAKCFSENNDFPVLGAFMDGAPIYSVAFPPKGILLIGSEANGISETLFPYITQHIAIPRYGSAESLNAGVAAGIIAAEWRQGERSRIGFVLPK